MILSLNKPLKIYNFEHSELREANVVRELYKKLKLSNLISLLINCIILFLILFFTIRNNSDKSIVVFIFYYPILIFINLMLYWMFKMKIFKTLLIIELSMFIPLILLLTEW